MTVWAPITVVSSIRGHLVVLAPLVLVVTVVVIARSIPTPRSSTVHRLRAATRCRALLVVVGVRAAVSVVSGTLGVLVIPASPVLVVLGVVVAGTITTPITRAVNRLRAAGGGTLLVVIGVGATITVVSGALGVLVVPAPVVLVVRTLVVAGTITTPITRAVNRLRAAGGGTLLVVIGVGATITVVSGALGVLVVPAPVVLVVRTLVVARPVSSPGTHAIHRLSTATSGTLLVVIGVGAARAAVRSTLGVLVVPAPPVGTSGLVARPVSSPGTHAIHRLGAPRGGALPVVIAVGAARAIVSGVLGDLVRPAALVLGALQGPPVFT